MLEKRVHNLGAERDTMALKIEVFETQNTSLKKENISLNEVVSRLWENSDASFKELFPEEVIFKLEHPGEQLKPKKKEESKAPILALSQTVMLSDMAHMSTSPKRSA